MRMTVYVLLFLSLTLFGSLFALLLKTMQDRTRAQKFERDLWKSQTENLLNLLADQKLLNRDLMNRLMSGDLPAFVTLTSQGSSVASEYVPQSDMAEIERLKFLYHASSIDGLGDTIYDDDELGTIRDLGNLP
jgi:hypothetical protein